MNQTLIYNIGLLATPTGRTAKGGKAQGEITFLRNAWVLAEDGIIKRIGTGELPLLEEGAELISAQHQLVTPGIIDAHTHLVFDGWRQNELDAKLHGASYLDILNAGGLPDIG